ncbi:MAG: TolC family protein [Marinilabiliales bacterium]|nr:TolC family protein [Marinilabiliales bacterium]
MRNLRLSSIVLLLLSPIALQAQKTMSLDEAIMQALENNYSLKISRNDEAIADNNVTLSPFLPTVTGTGRQSQTDNTSESSSSETDKTRTNLLHMPGYTLNWRTL